MNNPNITPAQKERLRRSIAAIGRAQKNIIPSYEWGPGTKDLAKAVDAAVDYRTSILEFLFGFGNFWDTD